MRYASTAAQMRAMDAAVIEGLGLPGVALMELAAAHVAEAVRRHYAAEAARGVAVVCGPGSNGGDGWAIARWLSGWGLPVAVWAVGEPAPGTDAHRMREIARAAGVPERAGVAGAGLVVDALFGTGLTRAPSGAYAEAIDQMEAHGAPIVAVDLPSGLHSDTGQAFAPCVRAARTVTFARVKVGALLGDGPDRCGALDVVDIGLDAATAPGVRAAAALPEGADLWPLWPVRGPDGHKGTHGHLLVIAGSAAMAGAAVLACRGALAGGVGRCTLVAPRGVRPRLAALPPEVMVLDGGEGDVLAALPDTAPYDALAVGPGLGGGAPLPAGLAQALTRAWASDSRPWVFDADALPCVGPPAASAGPRVLTPHPGEAARLLGCSIAAVQADRLGAADRLSGFGAALLKGRHTVVAAAGHLPSLNRTGSAALATGGSGDVLTGLVGALLARGVDGRDAARLGAFVHGLAGEHLSRAGPDGWTASDVARAIPEVLASRPGLP